jgi:hypothetical protein
VWAGITGNCLVGPHILPRRLAGNHCRDFPLHDLPKLVEDVRLAVRTPMSYTLGGAPAHFSRAVRDVLRQTDRPQRSPDFNLLGFYLCGYLKTLVYAASVDNEEELYRRIVDACLTTRNYPGGFRCVRKSMMARVEACIESHGGHFEQLL